MAYKSRNSTSNSKSKKPSYAQRSKMSKYSIIYDEDEGTMRCGFMNYVKYFPNLESDIMWEIEPGFENRIDLISKKFYGTSQFDWVIEQVNDLRDPIRDIRVGRKLLIPTIESIYRLT